MILHDPCEWEENEGNREKENDKNILCGKKICFQQKRGVLLEICICIYTLKESYYIGFP